MLAKVKKAALATAFSIFINDSKLELMSLGNLQEFNELTEEEKIFYDDEALLLNNVDQSKIGEE